MNKSLVWLITIGFVLYFIITWSVSIIKAYLNKIDSEWIIPLYELPSCWLLILEIHQHNMQNQPLTLMGNPHASVISRKSSKSMNIQESSLSNPLIWWYYLNPITFLKLMYLHVCVVKCQTKLKHTFSTYYQSVSPPPFLWMHSFFSNPLIIIMICAMISLLPRLHQLQTYHKPPFCPNVGLVISN